MFLQEIIMEKLLFSFAKKIKTRMVNKFLKKFNKLKTQQKT